MQKSARPKSAHPRNRGRKVSNSGSVNSSITSFDLGDVNKTEIKRHRDRLLYTTSKSSKVFKTNTYNIESFNYFNLKSNTQVKIENE